MRRRTRWSDPASRALVNAIGAAARRVPPAVPVQPRRAGRRCGGAVTFKLTHPEAAPRFMRPARVAEIDREAAALAEERARLACLTTAKGVQP